MYNLRPRDVKSMYIRKHRKYSYIFEHYIDIDFLKINNKKKKKILLK